MSYFWKPEGPATDFEQQLATSQYDPGAWWHFTTQAGRAFDLYNTMGLALHEGHVAQEEQRAGVYDASSNRALSGFYPGEARPEPQREKTISREEFLRQGYDRGGRIEWSPRTTEVRARIEAEELDKRDHEDMLLARTSTPFRSALGFGAAFLGSLPDPINLLPVGGAAAKGASMGRRVLAGARAGVLGTAAADAIVLPSARARGEDVGFGTLALDLTFGALIGGGIGAGGGVLHNRRVRSLAQEEESLARAFGEAGFDAGEASRRARDVVNVLADTAHRRDKVEAVRSWVGGQNREDAGRLLDKAMETLVRDGDMDVGSWAALLRGHELAPGESLLPRGVTAAVQRDFASMLEAVEKHGVPQVALGRMSSASQQALESIGRAGGMELVRDGRLVLPSNVVWALFNKGDGFLKGHRTADQVADLLAEAARFDRDAPVPAGGKGRAKRMAKLQDRLLESGFFERDKETGRIRINAETSLGSERRRLVDEMVASGIDRDRAEGYAKLHVAQSLAFQKAYGVDAVKALKRRTFKRAAGQAELELERGRQNVLEESRTAQPAGRPRGQQPADGSVSVSYVRDTGRPSDRVALPDGSDAFGTFEERTLADGRHLPEGKIVMERGVSQFGRGKGFLHIADVHGEEIRNAGYGSVQEFVWDLVNNFNEIWEGDGRSLTIVWNKLTKDGKKPAGFVELSKRGDVYFVKSAFPASGVFPNARKKRLLWRNAPPSSSTTGGSTPSFAQSKPSHRNPYRTPDGALHGQRGQSVETSIGANGADSNRTLGLVEFGNAEPGGAAETYRIFLAPDADASTIPHESAHIFLRELESVVANAEPGAVHVEQAKADIAALRRYAGVAEEGKLSEADYRTLQESVARGFEQYLAEGRAPNPALEGVFQRMARWLSSIYEDIKAYVAGTDGVELNDDVRQAFDRMLDPDRWGGEQSRLDVFDASSPAPDYTRPAPRPEIVPDTVEALERANDGILADMGRSPIDLEATRIVESGGASPEHLAELEGANVQLERINRIEEASLAALECIIGGVA